MKKLIGLAQLIILFSTALYSQQNTCGTVFSPMPKAQLEAFRRWQSTDVFRDNQKDTVAITFYIVETPGAGGVELSVETLERELQRVNRAYSAADVVFFMCGSPRLISGLGKYNEREGDLLNKSHRVANTINIFYVDELNTNSGSALCGYSEFPWRGEPKDRYIMMAKGCADNGATLAHELGHFFGLFHTHETANGREFVDGSNCNTAGDLLCDTPADPLLGYNNVANNCNYTGNQVDPKGVAYRPSVNNIMSYAPSQCRRLFSNDQYQLIKFINENNNNYLIDDCSFYPDFGIQNSLTTLAAKSGQLLNLDYQLNSKNINEDYELDIYFYFSEMEGGRDFIVSKQKVAVSKGTKNLDLNFDVPIPIYRGTGTYYFTAYLDPELKVVELNEKNNVQTFKVTIDNSGFGEATIFPNPAADVIKLFINDKKLFRKVSIDFYSFNGQLLYSLDDFKQEQEFIRELDISGLPSGLIIMSVLFKDKGERKSFRFLKE